MSLNITDAQDALTQKRIQPQTPNGAPQGSGNLADYDFGPQQPSGDLNAAGAPPPTTGPNVSNAMLPGSTAGDSKPGPTVAPPAGAAAPAPDDPFKAQGGGVNINGNWFPKDHPGAIEWLKNNPQAAPGGQPGTPATPGPTAPPTEPQTPNNNPNAPAAPGSTVTPEGNDTWRKAIMTQMGQKEVASVDDDVIKAQLDPMRAEAERAMRGEVREGAEAAFADQQDFGSPERVAARERMGNKVGLTAADLVGRETQARRDQIANSLKMYGDRMSDQERNQLQEKLTTMDLNLKKYLGDRDFELGKGDQDLKRRGLDDARDLGGRELGIRERLGMGDLNIRSILAQLQNQQFNKRFGLDVGMAESDANDRAMRTALGL